MNSPFCTYNPKPRVFTEAEVVATARQLLEEHETAREVAFQAANLVCGNCAGSGNTESVVMPGALVKCWACEGKGTPNEHCQAVPDLTDEDNLRIWKIGQLLKNSPHRLAVARLIREKFPTLYDEPMADS